MKTLPRGASLNYMQYGSLPKLNAQGFSNVLQCFFARHLYYRLASLQKKKLGEYLLLDAYYITFN